MNVKTLHYLHPDKLEGIKDINTFIDALEDYIHEDNVVKVIMEPGDATRYIFYIIQHEPNHRGYIITRPEYKQVWEVFHPLYPTFFGDINTYTAHLFTEIMNLLIGTKGIEHYYDFDNAVPINVREETDA